MNRIMTTMALIILQYTSALADQATLEKAVPADIEGYQSETEEATDSKLVRWFEGKNDQYIVVEIDFGGQLVAAMRNTFHAMKLGMDTVEINQETYVYDGEMFSLLVEREILVRAYGTAPKNDVESMLRQLNVAALKELAVSSQ